MIERTVLMACAVLAAALTGCGGSLARISPPAIAPSAAGAAALAQYDGNGDGAIAGEELNKAPAIRAALARIDTNADGRVTGDEIATRIRAWQASRVGLTSFSSSVTLDGEPLGGALVTLRPERFLGENVKPASGTSNEEGMVGLSIAEEDRPDPQVYGVQYGLYTVHISKASGGDEQLPSKYNGATTLGCEVAHDSQVHDPFGPTFTLTSE